MPGIADLLYLGQPDPRRQLAAMLSGQQQPPAAAGAPPQGAGPGLAAPAGPGPNPDAPAPNAQQASADPGATHNPSPADPPPPGSQPQPQALQSTPAQQASYQTLANPPNIMSLYLQMDQRNRASDQINRGLALIAANHSAPSMRQAIMDSVGSSGDAGSTVGNLMSLYQGQQQMAAQQQMLGQADAIDQKNGWPSGTARAEILAGRGPDLIKAMEPTDMQRNYNWARQTYAANHPGASPDQIEAGAQSILLGAGGGGGAVGSELRSMNLARSQWLNDPANQGKPPPGYLTDETKWKIYSQDLSDAKTQFGGVNDSLNTFVGHMSDVANNPSLDKITGSTGNILTGAFEGLVPGEVNNLKVGMTGLQNEAKDIASRGGPKGVNQNLRTLGSSSDDFVNTKLTNYRDTVIAPRMRQALTAQANANGAAGQATTMPGYLNHYLDKMYQAGGDLDIGGSPKQNTPDTGPDGKPLPQPDPAHQRDFWTALEHRGPDYALKMLSSAGFDTSKLR